MKSFPKYVRVEGNCCLQFVSKENGVARYWRHGGMWMLEAEYINGELISKSDSPPLINKRLIECSKKEWAEDNEGYTSADYGPYA